MALERGREGSKMRIRWAARLSFFMPVIAKCDGLDCFDGLILLNRHGFALWVLRLLFYTMIFKYFDISCEQWRASFGEDFDYY